MQQKMPTMVDVSREARVGLKTVSRYVNGATNIHPELRSRIAAAIDKLGYRRNLAAAAIRPGHTTRTIGLIITDLSNPYYSMLARAIEQTARSRGYLLTIANSDEDGARHDVLVDRMLEERLEGIISVPPKSGGRPWETLTSPLPAVVIVDRFASCPQGDVVIGDNRAGARDGTRALIDAGARRIAFIGDAPEIPTVAERLLGYEDALRERRIDPDDRLIRYGAHSMQEALDVVGQLIEEGVADALFASNNRVALGAVAAFKATRQRLGLVGFDDFESAAITDPPVSTVSYDVAEMGHQATRALFERIEGLEVPGRTTLMPTRLTLRGSESPR